MAKRVSGKFEGLEGAKTAKAVLQKSLRAVGSSKIKIEQKGEELAIEITDSVPSKEKAAYFGAARLVRMLKKIDKAIK